MKKVMTFILGLTVCASLFVGCSQPTTKPEVLKTNELNNTQVDVKVDGSKDISSTKRNSVSDKTIQMKEIFKLDDKFYKEGYYGVPININGKYYKIPAIKLLNYYFIDLDAISKIYGIAYTVKDDGIVLTPGKTIKLNTSSLIEGKVNPTAIDSKNIKLLNDEKNLGINHLNKNYISLISLSNILPEGSKLYIDRETGVITNKKPNIIPESETTDGLLRKSISIDAEHELLVREGTYGKMLVVYDIYGSSLDITPDNISFSKDLQNIFLHKTSDGKIYMFGLMGDSVEIYQLNVTKNLTINVSSIGAIQKQAQNIYYINNKYVAVGRTNVFGINIGKDIVNETNLKKIVDIKECGGAFNNINGVNYLTIKDNKDKISIYKLNIETFTLDLVKLLDLKINFKDVALNFMYSFVEDKQISIYSMDSTGYIYNIKYDVVSNKSTVSQTDKFKLFYNEKKYPVELTIDLVKAGGVGQSELSLSVNGKYLGNNILVFGVEDNWVYCSEYNKTGDNASIYAFRYNAITGIKDYANAS